MESPGFKINISTELIVVLNMGFKLETLIKTTGLKHSESGCHVINMVSSHFFGDVFLDDLVRKMGQWYAPKWVTPVTARGHSISIRKFIIYLAERT